MDRGRCAAYSRSMMTGAAGVVTDILPVGAAAPDRSRREPICRRRGADRARAAALSRLCLSADPAAAVRCSRRSPGWRATGPGRRCGWSMRCSARWRSAAVAAGGAGGGRVAADGAGRRGAVRRDATSCCSASAPRATTRCPPPARRCALLLMLRAGADAGRGGASPIGALLAAAAAAKISYAIPAAAYGLYALVDRRAQRPSGSSSARCRVRAVRRLDRRLGARRVPVRRIRSSPARPRRILRARRAGSRKLSPMMKLVDTIKFLALGPALLALVVAMMRPGPPACRLRSRS